MAGPRHVQARHLSGGTRQKLNLVLAALGDPDVLLLDEPYLLRRRAVVGLLFAIPLVFYLARRGDHTGQATRFLLLGLGFTVSSAGLFATSAMRSLEPRLHPVAPEAHCGSHRSGRARNAPHARPDRGVTRGRN